MPCPKTLKPTQFEKENTTTAQFKNKTLNVQRKRKSRSIFEFRAKTKDCACVLATRTDNTELDGSMCKRNPTCLQETCSINNFKMLTLRRIVARRSLCQLMNLNC